MENNNSNQNHQNGKFENSALSAIIALSEKVGKIQGDFYSHKATSNDLLVMIQSELQSIREEIVSNNYNKDVVLGKIKHLNDRLDALFDEKEIEMNKKHDYSLKKAGFLYSLTTSIILRGVGLVIIIIVAYYGIESSGLLSAFIK